MATGSDLLSGLNDEQRRAVCHPGGPALVIAGAGSGKTRVLTHRIAHLVAGGVAARGILAVTFTNKAAQEMKLRVEMLCGLQPDLWIGTFHSMCSRFLRLELRGHDPKTPGDTLPIYKTESGYVPEFLGSCPLNSNFVIVDDQDQLTVLKEVLAELKVDDRVYRPQWFREQIGRAKNRLLTPQKLKRQVAEASGDIVAAVYAQYQKKLFASNALDFDDLLMATVVLLQKDPDVLAHYQKKFSHVLIDEYQDTNHAQYVLVQLLAGLSKGVFAVGDEDQSIYSFRGAEIHNILDFERDFPNTTIYRLAQNYRSTQRILDAANALIRNNRQRKGKVLWTENTQGERVTAFQAQDEREEVDFILGAVESLHEEGTPLEHVVIFYRVHALSRVFEEGLRLRGIPYAIVGGIGFYERREIKDALAYLRVLVNSSDSISFKRIINVPSRGIGPSSMAVLEDLCNTRNICLSTALEIAVAEALLGKGTCERVSKFMSVINAGAKRAPELGITGTLDWMLEESGYLPALRLENTIEAKTRMENLKELDSATQEFEENHPGACLADFLADIALWTDLDRYENTQKKITLMSLHSSKGLEFPCVFIAGLEEGVFPYSYWGTDQRELEEERRLLYVGMTRARQRLTLSCARNRMLFGTRKVAQVSRFLHEIDGEFLAKYSSSSQDMTQSHCEDPESFRETKQPRGLDDWIASPVARNDNSLVTSAGMDFCQGQRIIHPKFGPGKILTCFDKGENFKVSIQFQSEEHPRLLSVKYAKLQKVDASQVS